MHAADEIERLIHAECRWQVLRRRGRKCRPVIHLPVGLLCRLILVLQVRSDNYVRVFVLGLLSIFVIPHARAIQAAVHALHTADRGSKIFEILVLG